MINEDDDQAIKYEFIVKILIFMYYTIRNYKYWKNHSNTTRPQNRTTDHIGTKQADYLKK